MLEYIRGKLVEAFPHKVVVYTGGFGHAFFISSNTYEQLPLVEEEVTLYISTVIREDVHKDFAFLRREERDLFEQLGGISGIGAKTALALISHVGYEELSIALFTENLSLLSQVPGVGKKKAARLMIELKDKINPQEFYPSLTSPSPLPEKRQIVHDATNALIRLGYTAGQAQHRVKHALLSCGKEYDLNTLITRALKSSPSCSLPDA